MDKPHSAPPESLTLDVGGEGRHARAWNVNPSPVKTLGPEKGRSIPRHILGRADAIPFPDHSADLVIVERTPLTRAALREIARVVAPGGVVILRHALSRVTARHVLARQLLPGRITQRVTRIGRQPVLETRFQLDLNPGPGH